MVEVWRARTAPVPRGESCVCPMRSSFMLGLPPSDRTLMITRYKPLQGSTTVVGGGLASALVESALPVRYFPSTIRSQKSEHDSRRGMSRATTPHLGLAVPRPADAATQTNLFGNQSAEDKYQLLMRFQVCEIHKTTFPSLLWIDLYFRCHVVGH